MSAWTLSDSERKCARCKIAKAVVIFDNEPVCADCARKLERELIAEGERDDRRKAATRTR